jgi:hypothetical protein
MWIAARVSAAVVVLVAIGAFAPGRPIGDPASFEAGYRAVSNPTEVRAALSGSGMSSATFCEDVLRRVIDTRVPNVLRHRDFLHGCRLAVADAME